MGPDQQPPVTGNPNPFPEFYHWSDVAFLEFAQFMTDTKKPLTNLKGVWQRQIINADTQAVTCYLFGVSTVVAIDEFGPGK